MKPMQAIDGPLGASWPGKARGLGDLLGAGIRVPPAWIWRCEAPPQPAELRSLLAGALRDHGALIVRSAFGGEDEASSSAAGLGLSVGPVHDLESAHAAIDAVEASRRRPALLAYRGASAQRTDAIIVQAYVRLRRLVVAAILPGGLNYVEVHSVATALADGLSPVFAGPVERWPDPSGAAVAGVLGRVRAAFELGPRGYDAELAVDERGLVHVVQLRPLVHDLLTDGEAFITAARAHGEDDKLAGQLVLDAEHNPEVLSVAHSSLIDWIAAHQPGSGGPRTILGWLYTASLVRDLAGDAPPEAAASPRDALRQLTERFIPDARARLEEIDRSLANADASATAGTIDVALAAFGSMLRRYVSVLIPARAAAGRSLTVRTDAPLTTRAREEFTDVLPAAWDIASPPLIELHDFAAAPTPGASTDPIDDDEALGLLGEWDDHFFALGLAAVRRVFVRAATVLSLTSREVFGLTLDELRSVLAAGSVSEPMRGTLAARSEERRTWNELRPPDRIDDGRALPSLQRGWLRGAAIGVSFEGVLAQRRNLEDLLSRPPAPSAIVVLPALTAQSALALQSLAVRAIVCEFGGAMSHAALMCRELQMSALIGCRGCTSLPDGARATLDATTGALRPQRKDSPTTA